MPPVVKSLLLLNVAAFIIDSLFHVSAYLGLWYWGSGMFMPHQFFTYMFMHGGFTHLFFNMFALWMFGRIMEQVWGGTRFLLYYFVCGIGAGLVQEFGQVLGIIAPYAMTIGASGAVYAILGSYIVIFLIHGMAAARRLKKDARKAFLISGVMRIFIVVALTLSVSLYDKSVDVTAHMAGLIFGYFATRIWYVLNYDMKRQTLKG